MIRATNFFSVNSSESDTDEERDKSAITVESMKKIKKKNQESRDSITGKEGEIAARDVNSEAGNGVKESKKKNMEKKVDSEVGDDGGKTSKKKKKKKKKSKKVSGGDEIGNSESSKVNESSEGNRSNEKAPVNTDNDDAKRETGKRKRVNSDLGAEENTRDTSNKKRKPSVDSELEENSLSSAKKAKKQSEDPAVEENNNNDSTADAEKKQSVAEGNSLKDPKKKRKKKMKQSEDPEAEENSKDSAKDAKRKQSVNPEIEEPNKDSTEVAKKKRSMDSEAQGNDLNSTENAKKKRKKKKKQSEDPEAVENNNGGTIDGKKKGKKQKGTKSDEVVATPSSKSTKKVKFSDQVEVFPTEDEESEEEGFPTELVRGKRFTKEEDELVRKAVLEYVENHALGDEGINMVMDCKSRPQLRGCWKEITAALPWRTHHGVYHRAHTLFEQGSKGIWTKEDLETVIEYQKKHGNDWRTLADAMGKHRKHVKDAWRRIRLASKKKGHWSMEEYQNLFDLVNKDLRMKAFQEKRTKHGMLRDNIPWMAISDQLGTRNHTFCCSKWYDQLSSPMVAKGIWANVDDYRLLDELTKLDAACVDDVDWDDLLENRDGDACRQRWNQMVHHIGLPGTKTFAEQVEILSQRYCPDIAEDREDFDNRPYEDQSSPER